MKSNIFKKAHELTKKIIKIGDNYRATFRLCLSFVYSQIKKGVKKMVELKGTEKQVKWATEIREQLLIYVNLFEEVAKDDNSKDVQETRNAIEKILNVDSAKFYIDNMKSLTGYDAKFKLDSFKEKRRNAKLEYMNFAMTSFANRI